jgi:FkbM family methyltransferase
MLRSALKQGLSSIGLSVHHLGDRTQMSGHDFWHDAYALLGCPHAPIVVDVGANVGQSIDECRRVIPDAQITAFEPGPDNVRELTRRFWDDPGIHVEACALGDTTGSSPIHLFRDSVNHSFLPAPDHGLLGAVDVALTTLDTYCAGHHVDHIDILKVDTQGFDLRVMAGATSLLARRAIGVVRLEVIMRPFYDGQPSLATTLHTMQATGYELVGIYDPFYLNNRFSHVDLAFTQPR